MAVMGMRWPEPTVRALPRLVSTFQFETVDSFITRLAHANHVEPRDLRTHVGRADSHRVERLGTLSGYAPAVLRTRLRGLSTVDGHATRQRAHSRPACRWCSARRGANEPVHAGFLTMSPSATAISGGSARPHKPGQTKLISPLDRAVLTAARRHKRLCGEHQAEIVDAALNDALRIMLANGDSPDYPNTIWQTPAAHPDGRPFATPASTWPPTRLSST